LTTGAKSDIQKGVTAHGWGNHADEGYATEEFVEDAIDDIEIGGRNYLPDSRFIKSNQEAINWRRLPTDTSVQVEDGIAIYTRLKDYNAARLERPVYLEKGIYTYSMRAKSEFSFNMDLSYVEYLKKVSVPSNDFTIHNAVIKVVHKRIVYLNFRYPSASIMPVGSQYEVEYFKLEKGTKPTDWTPAPEDQVTDWNDTNPDSFAFLKNKPTTFPPSSHTHTFASLTSKPTTIAGYGITDFNSLGDARWAL